MSKLAEATSVVSALMPIEPRVGVILGSGLGAVADEVEEAVAISYGDIPGFPCTTVPGHQGRLVLGTMEGVGVAVMMGRPHLYEGFTPARVGFPVQLLGALGVETLVVTNAAGGLRPSLEVGELMLLEDHVSLPGMAGLSPLMGIPGAQERFVIMAEAYDETLRRLVLEAGGEKGIRVSGGVYAMVVGPNYETPAEARFLRQLGADAVGMSTVPEVIVARWLGMRVLGISCITNLLFGPPAGGEGGHAAVLSVAETAASDIAFLLRPVLRHHRVMSDE
ncbi:MAG: purine-nucleoside phosphorylase [Chloroflexota bacterium]